MAVIDVYENQAKLGTPASQTSGVHPDMGGQMALARANANLTNTMVEGGQKLYEQIAIADVMKANNDYNMQMSRLQNELLQNKEENARDNLTKYEEGFMVLAICTHIAGSPPPHVSYVASEAFSVSSIFCSPAIALSRSSSICS